MEEWGDGGPLPVFAYGTLRTGEPNSRLLDGRRSRTWLATVRGLRLHDACSYPYAVHTGRRGDMAVGELISLKTTLYNETLQRLDRLEGYDPDRPEESPYHRVTVTVHRIGRAVPRSAWTYVVADPARVRGLPVIPGGDWTRRCERLSGTTEV